MYDVALLIEHTLTELDARQVVGLHESVEDDVTYHLLQPAGASAGSLAPTLGALGTPEVAPPSAEDVVAGEEAQDLQERETAGSLETSAAMIAALGRATTTTTTHDDPVEALQALVAERHAAEVIVLTEPHVVREFLGLDWSARARRRLDVPTLHLIEHETFAEQAGGEDLIGY